MSISAHSADRYSPNERVRVLAGVDERGGQIGTVRATYADAGDMVHILDFEDGTTDRYIADELQALNAPPMKRRAEQPRELPPLARGGEMNDITEPTPEEQG